MNLLQLKNENASMEHKIKSLMEENSELEEKIKLMEIQQANDEAVVEILKNHVEERREFNSFLRDDSNFEPAEIERRAKLREEIISKREDTKRAKASRDVEEKVKD